MTILPWNLLIASYLFLGGAAGGAFVITGLLDLRGANAKITKWGGFVSTSAIIVGLLFLILDLGHPERALSVFYNLSSVMAVGSIIITIFTVVGLAYTSFHFEVFPWSKSVETRKMLAVLGIVLGFATMYYTGLLIGLAQSRPLWNQAAIPLLFTVSGASTGAAMVLLGPTLIRSKEDGLEAQMQGLEKADALLIGAEAFIIASLLFVLNYSTDIANQTAQEIVSGSLSAYFWAGLVAVGMVVPLLLYAAIFKAGKTSPRLALAATLLASIAVLWGGLTLRYIILGAGQGYELMSSVGFNTITLAAYTPTLTEIEYAAALFAVLAIVYIVGALTMFQRQPGTKQPQT